MKGFRRHDTPGCCHGYCYADSCRHFYAARTAYAVAGPPADIDIGSASCHAEGHEASMPMPLCWQRRAAVRRHASQPIAAAAARFLAFAAWYHCVRFRFASQPPRFHAPPILSAPMAMSRHAEAGRRQYRQRRQPPRQPMLVSHATNIADWYRRQLPHCHRLPYCWVWSHAIADISAWLYAAAILDSHYRDAGPPIAGHRGWRWTTTIVSLLHFATIQ